MAIITETRTPYEFLARWDEKTGVFKGAHIVFYDAVLKDGVQLTGAPSKAFGIGDGMAFPLADIVGTTTANALALVDTQAAQIAALNSDKTAAEQARDAALVQVAALTADKAALQAQLDSYLSPTSPNGVPEWVYASQAYKALILSGLMPAVQAGLAVMPGVEGELARADFEKSARFYRANPTLAALGTALGLTTAQLDQLFITAATL